MLLRGRGRLFALGEIVDDDKRPTPLTETEVRELVQELLTEPEFTERNNEYDRMRGLLKQQRKVVIPGIKNLQAEYRTPRLHKDASRYRNRLISAPFDIEIAAQGPGPKAVERAQRMKNYAKRSFARWLKQKVFAEPLYHMTALGRGHLVLRLNPEIIPLDPVAGEDPEAFLTRKADDLAAFANGERGDLFELEPATPWTVYWTKDRRVKMLAMKTQLNPLKKLFDGKDKGYWGEQPALTSLRDGLSVISGADSPWKTEVTYYYVTDAHYVYHLVSGDRAEGAQALGCYLNVFGVPTIFDIEGEITGEPEALWSARPLIDGLYSLAPLENIFGTMIMAGGVESVQQQRTLEQLPGAEAQRDREENAENMQLRLLNNKFVLPPMGWKITDTGYELPASVIQAYQLIREQMDDFGYPRVLARPEEISATSGYDRAKAQDAVTSDLDPPLQNWADCLTDILSALFTGIKTLGVPVTVRNLNDTPELGAAPQQVQEAITVDPDDIIDVDISVTFDSVTTYTRMAMQEQGLGQMDAGMMHRDEYLAEVRGVPDVRRWRDEKMVSDTYDFADKLAFQDMTVAVERIRAWAQQQAMNAAQLQEPSATAASDALGAEQQPPPPDAPMGGGGTGAGGTASYALPTGGRAPIAPTPNAEAELGMTGQQGM